MDWKKEAQKAAKRVTKPWIEKKCLFLPPEVGETVTVFIVMDCGVHMFVTNNAVIEVQNAVAKMRLDFCDHKLITWFFTREEHVTTHITSISNCAGGI